MYVRRGLYARAIPVLEQAVEIRREAGGDPAGLVVDLRRLAEAVWQDRDRSFGLFQEAVALAERELGPDDPHLAAALTDLAQHVMRRPEPDAAARSRPLIERALAILRRHEGDVRVALAHALHVSAFVVEGSRRDKVSRIEEALELRRSLYGEDHTGVAAILNDMALMLEPIDPAAADTLLERAVEINARIHGPDHAQTLTMMNNLAGRWRDSGNHAKAVPLYREVLRRRQTAYPDNKMARAYTLHGLGWSIAELGRPEEAEGLLRDALGLIQTEGFGHDDLIYHLARNTLGRSIALQGRYDEAEPLLRDSYIWVIENRPEIAFLPFMLDRLASLYDAWGRPAEAAEYRGRRAELERRPLEE
jgi:tetratricopeptide (TPR) repeat protein